MKVIPFQVRGWWHGHQWISNDNPTLLHIAKKSPWSIKNVGSLPVTLLIDFTFPAFLSRVLIQNGGTFLLEIDGIHQADRSPHTLVNTVQLLSFSPHRNQTMERKLLITSKPNLNFIHYGPVIEKSFSQLPCHPLRTLVVRCYPILVLDEPQQIGLHSIQLHGQPLLT